MQSVSNKYKADSIAGIRQLGWMVMMASDKRLQFGINLWTWNVSTWDGGDLWAGDDDVLTEWNRYRYYDYSDRMLSMEWERQLSVPYSSARAFGSFDLQNTDGFLNYTPVAKAESLYESFSLPLDPAVWFNWSNGQAVVAGGQLQVTSRATAGFFGINTVYRYDLTGSYVRCQLVDAGNQALPSWEVYPVELQVDLDNYVHIYISDNNVIAGKRVGGVHNDLATLDYYEEIHKWFRIRESGGTTYWEYSQDGDTWVPFHSEINPINVTALVLNVFAGTSSDEGVVTAAAFDNINTGSSGAPLTTRGFNSLISDNFNYDTPSLPDDNIWSVSDPTTVDVSGGVLTLTNPANDTSYYGVFSVSSYNLTGVDARIELVNAGNQGLSSWEVYPLLLTGTAGNELFIIVSNDAVLSYKRVSGSLTQVDSTPYNSGVHKWFRIRESSGTTYWEYSTNGNTWTQLHSEATPITVTAVDATILFGTYSNEVSTSAVLDNFSIGLEEDTGEMQVGVSPIGSYMVPGRPFRLFAGFSGEVHQGIVGVTTDAPEYNERERIVSFHGHDFFGKISDLTLDTGLTVEAQTTDEILENIFTNIVGLEAGQFVLDASFNEVAFVFWPRGTALGDIFAQLMQAEIGRLFMDEGGIIRFYNRERLVGQPIITLDKTNIVDLEQERQSNVRNSIEVVSRPSVVQDTQTVFQLSIVEDLPIGSSEFFFDTFVGEDRVPVVEIEAITVYTANTASDGSGTDITSQVDIQSAEILGDTVKVTISNGSGSNGYLTTLEISGRPAIQQPEIRAIAKNQQSIKSFEERKLLIENNLIQSQSDAESLAYLMLFYTQEYNNTLRVKIKAIPALQAGDGISVDYGSIQGLFVIENVTLRLDSDGFSHYLGIRHSPFSDLNLWIWDASEWDGGDVWGF